MLRYLPIYFGSLTNNNNNNIINLSPLYDTKKKGG